MAIKAKLFAIKTKLIMNYHSNCHLLITIVVLLGNDLDILESLTECCAGNISLAREIDDKLTIES